MYVRSEILYFWFHLKNPFYGAILNTEHGTATHGTATGIT